MNNQLNNIFSNIPKNLNKESFEVLMKDKNIKIERIVSMGHASPPGFWYDQDRDEFVILIKGSAGLLVEGRKEVIVMKPGNYLNIPAHARHRVEWTDALEETVWMAVFY